MKLRTIVFWVHLSAGVSAGLVIFIMSVTGALLAFQPQILNIVERGVRRVEPRPGAARLGAQAIVQAAAAAKPGAQPATLTLDADARAAALVSFGTAGNVYIDPYSGAVLGHGSERARAVFRTLTDWHRWLGRSGPARATARSITGASNLLFLGLAMSGLFLWWPRQWTRARLRAVAMIDPRLRGKARDFNWHNAIGFWSAPVLIVLTLTGVVISYPWAGNLVYRMSGSPVPPRPGSAAAAPQMTANAHSAQVAPQLPDSLNILQARAAATMPTWRSMALRLPARPSGPVSVTMTDASHWNRFARSQLTLDGATGDVVRWEPYAASSPGQKVRGWMRFAHTGELGGIAGQAVAGLASAGGAFLVVTGLGLALRRCAAWLSTGAREDARAA